MAVSATQALSLDDLLRFLSVAQYSAKEDEVASRYHDVIATKKDKHLRLLDAIALLLVQKKGGDVAAVTYKFSPDSSTGAIIMRFMFSKNHPCSSAEFAHINSIFDYLKDVQANKITGGSAAADLLGIIVHNCASKVKDRFTKLGKAWTYLKEEAVEWKEPPAAMTEIPLKQFIGLEHPQTTKSYVETLKAHLDRFEQVPLEGAALRKLVVDTYLLEVSRATFDELYNGCPVPPVAARVQRKLAKFSRYLKDCMYLVRQAMRHKQYVFQIEEVSPTRLEPSVTKTPAAVVKALSPQLPLDEPFDLKTFVKSTGCNPNTFNSSTRPTDRLVHCECNLAAKLRGPNNDRAGKAPLRIGVSKRCCLHCVTLLSILSKDGIKISGCHGKIYSGWAFPPELLGSPAHTEMAKRMEEWAVKAMTIYGTRRFSDSSGGEGSPGMSDDSEREMAMVVQEYIAQPEP